MGTGGQTYVFQTIGAILLLAPYALCLLLLTIPRVRDFIRIRGLFDASTSRKSESEEQLTYNGIVNPPKIDQDDEAEDVDRLGATTQRLRFRWWAPVLSAVILTSVPAALLHLVYLAPFLQPADQPSPYSSPEWIAVWVGRTLSYSCWALVVTTLAAFRPRLARPLDSFDLLIIILIALPVVISELFPSSLLVGVSLALYPGNADPLLTLWWPLLSLTRITAVTLMLFVYISQRPLTDLGLTLWLSPSDWARIAIALTFCAFVGVPICLSIGMFDEIDGSVWQAFKLRWQQEWESTPWNQPYFFALLFSLIALPQEFLFRGVIQQLMHMFIDLQHDVQAFTQVEYNPKTETKAISSSVAFSTFYRNYCQSLHQHSTDAVSAALSTFTSTERAKNLGMISINPMLQSLNGINNSKETNESDYSMLNDTHDDADEFATVASATSSIQTSPNSNAKYVKMRVLTESNNKTSVAAPVAASAKTIESKAIKTSTQVTQQMAAADKLRSSGHGVYASSIVHLPPKDITEESQQSPAVTSETSQSKATASTPLLAADYTEQPMLMPVASKAASVDTKPMSADDETLSVAAHVRRVGLRFRRLLREQPPSWTEMYYPEAPKRTADQSNCSDRLYAMRRWLGMPLWKHWLVLIVSSLIHALAIFRGAQFARLPCVQSLNGQIAYVSLLFVFALAFGWVWRLTGKITASAFVHAVCLWLAVYLVSPGQH